MTSGTRPIIPRWRRFQQSMTAALATAAVAVLAVAHGDAVWAADTLSAAQAHEKASRREITLVDVRTPEEWAQSGVPAPAHAITMHQPGPQFMKQLDEALGGDRTKPLAIICRTGNRTGSLVGPLEKAGYTNVINVAEGMAGSQSGPGWVKAGLPVRPWAAGQAAPR